MPFGLLNCWEGASGAMSPAKERAMAAVVLSLFDKVKSSSDETTRWLLQACDTAMNYRCQVDARQPWQRSVRVLHHQCATREAGNPAARSAPAWKEALSPLRPRPCPQSCDRPVRAGRPAPLPAGRSCPPPDGFARPDTWRSAPRAYARGTPGAALRTAPNARPRSRYPSAGCGSPARWGYLD